jgi:hypothetical protein
MACAQVTTYAKRLLPDYFLFFRLLIFRIETNLNPIDEVSMRCAALGEFRPLTSPLDTGR